MNSSPVHVHVIRPAQVDAALLDCLDSSEKARAESFRFPVDAHRWSACRSALKWILSQETGLPIHAVHLDFLPMGKPVLPPPHHGIHFNLSHCDDLALIAVSRIGPVGVDVEPLNRAPLLIDCESSFCHPLEREKLLKTSTTREANLLKLWTCKEALLKCSGEGLSHPPDRIHLSIFGQRVDILSADNAVGPDSKLHLLDHPLLHGYQAVLCTEFTNPEIHIVDSIESVV